MNKILLILLLSSTVCFSQTENFSLQFKYRPNQKYLSTVEKCTKFKVEKIASDATLRYFDSLGVKRVQKGSKSERYDLLISFKNQEENGAIFFDIIASGFDYRGKINSKNINKESQSDTIYSDGYVDFSNDFKIETTNSSVKLPKTFKFPVSPMIIGDTISYNHSINYDPPLQRSIYSSRIKLIFYKVKNGVAYFKTLKNKISLTKDYRMSVKGALRFNINQGYINYSSFETQLFVDEVIDEETSFKHKYFEKVTFTTELENP